MASEPMPPNGEHMIVESIQDLTRVIIALLGDFGSKSDAVRRLAELSIPTGRIAAILSMAPKDVSSVLTKARKSKRGSATSTEDSARA